MQHPPDAPYVPEAAGGPPAGAVKKPMSAGMIACLTVAGALVLGIVGLAVFAIVAVRRFERVAKIADAKNEVRSIAHAQMNAFTTSGRLCGSALPVPKDVPRGTKHVPSAAAGEDFHRGSPADGWTCLKYEVTTPIRYQYELRVGGGYKAPARGGPDPGPDGFEASAEGDLDGDGKTSLFVQTGRLDRTTNTLTVEDDIFVADEEE